jgi:hypothetical protein
MKLPRSLAALCLVALACLGAELQTKPGRPIMVAEYGASGNRLLQIDTNGMVVWEHKPPSIAVIFQVLPDNRVLYAFGGNPTGAREVNHEGEEIWKFMSKSPQVLGCERLANGNTLIGEQGPPQALEVAKDGTIVHITPLHTSHQHFHQQVRNLHRLANGNILAAHEGEGAIREVTSDGAVVWEYTGVPMAGDAIRLPNGNTLIACGTQKRLIEVTREKKTVWEFGSADAPELNLTWVFSAQPLKNGNLLVSNFLRGQEGKGAHAFEITRDKKVVWGWADHKLVKSITMARAIGE